MTDRSVNPARGEVGLALDGAVYPMLPTYEALSRIEAKLGAISALAYRCTNPERALTVRELAIIACEGIHAAGADRSDANLRDVKEEKIARLIAEDSVMLRTMDIAQFLVNLCTGGTKPKKNEPTPPESPT